MVKDGAFSHKIGYVTTFKGILNFKGHPNCITVSQVAELVDFAIGGASAVNGLRLQPKHQACLSVINITVIMRNYFSKIRHHYQVWS